MLFGLVVIAHVMQIVFGEKKEDGKTKRQKRDVQAQLLRSKQKLARVREVNEVYDAQIDKLNKEIADLGDCIAFQKDLIKQRQAEFEHLESVNGVCHCNECIENDIKANRRKRIVKKYQPTEELWME
ncbi:unnamed protein product [Owenia fusiformis]|uniref:Uncharacterized protein n=1 Tax=Owenia fusiformis TaxID=6347 RepID=A0A8J1XRR3_OWEFU|nr:unnamed protein product [Owenia fusiformis]